MVTEQNKTLLRRLFEEAINKGDLNVIDEVIDSNYVNHNFPTPVPGTEGFKQVVTMVTRKTQSNRRRSSHDTIK